MNLDSYTGRAEEFLRREGRLDYRLHAGLRSDEDRRSLFEEYGGLFTLEILQQLLGELEASEYPRRRRLRHLFLFALTRRLAMESLPVLEKLEADGEPLRWERNREVDVHNAPIVLANTESREERKLLHAWLTSIVEAGNEMRWRMISLAHETAVSLGASSCRELHEIATGLDLDMLRMQVKHFLDASSLYYRRLLERFSLHYLGISMNELGMWDMERLRRAEFHDRCFRDLKPISLLKRTLYGLGIDLKKQTSIHIDSQERSGKKARPRCCAVSVPDEIYLVNRPAGGINDFYALFHEAGHALFLSHVRRDLPFEFRYLGDAAVDETYGFLFQYLTLNEEWRRDFLRMKTPDPDFVEYNKFRKLLLLREAAARFLFDLHLHGPACKEEGPQRLKKRYSSIMSEALMVEVEGEEAFLPQNVFFDSVRFLRGWIFEAELREMLQQRFGIRWYSRPAAGEFLADLWSYGRSYTVEELAGRVRLLKLSLEPIKRELL